MKNRTFSHFRVALLCIILSMNAFSTLFAEPLSNCGSSCPAQLVGRVTFANKDASSTALRWSLDDIDYGGVAEQSFTVRDASAYTYTTGDIVPSTGAGNGGNYTIVKNPSSVNGGRASGTVRQLMNVNTDGIFLYRSDNQIFAIYTIKGLNKYQSSATDGDWKYCVRVKMYNVGTSAASNSNNVIPNPRLLVRTLSGDGLCCGDIANATTTTTNAAYGNRTGTWSENNPSYNAIQRYGDYTVFEGTVVLGGQGNRGKDDDGFQLAFNFDFDGSQDAVVGIEEIEVYGCIVQKIESSNGYDICAGTPTMLTAMGIGTASDTYEWRTGGTSFETATPYGTGKQIEVKPKTATRYWVRSTRAGVTLVTLDQVITPVNCCGVGASIFTVPKICNSVTVNGDDSEIEWNMTSWQEVTKVSTGGFINSTLGNGNSAGKWRMMYDKDYIYLYVRVYDDQQPYNSYWTVADDYEQNGYNGDGVEIYMDAGSACVSGGKNLPVQIGLTYPNTAISTAPGKYRNQNCATTFIGYEAVVKPWTAANKYWEMEVRIPAADNGVDLTGEFIRVEVGITQSNSTSGTSNRGSLMHTWTAEGAMYEHLEKLHTAPLSDCASAKADPKAICNNDSTELSTQMKTANTTLSYTWQKSATENGTYSPAGETGGDDSHNYVTVAPTTTTWYRAIYDGVPTCPVEVKYASITAATTTASPQNLCAGGTLTLTGTTNATTANGQWGWKKGSDSWYGGTWVTGPSNDPADKILSKTAIAADAGNYFFIVREGCEVASDTVKVNAVASNTLTLASGNNTQTVCLNTAIDSIKYSTTGATGATITWLPSTPAGITAGTWAANAISISGTPSAAGTYNYTVETTGGCGTPQPSLTGKITVRTAFNAGAIDATGQTLCLNGTPAEIGNTTAASGGDSIFTYSWYKDGTLITGATGATYTPDTTDTNTAGTYVYTRKAKDGACQTAALQSTGSWTLKVNALPTATLTPPAAFCEGELATEPTKTISGYTIAWYSNTAASIAVPNISALPAGDTTFYYTVEDNATHCVSAVNDYKVKVNAKPAINGETSVGIGENITLTGTPAGGTWSSTPDTGVTTVDPTGVVTGVSSGTTTITYTVNGCSATYTVTVSNIGPIKPNYSIYFCPGESVTLEGGGKKIDKWLWFKKGDPAPDHTSASTNPDDTLKVINPVSAADSGLVWIFRAYDAAGTEFLSQEIKLLKNPDYGFRIDSASVTACEGVTVLLSPVNTQAGASYDWSSTDGQTSTANTFTLDTSAASSGTITVIGKATNYCEKTVTVPYKITAPPTADISYTGISFCTSLTAAQPVALAGTGAYAGGIYRSTTGLSINAVSGAITPSASTASTTPYIVTYTTPASGGCAAVSATTQVTITQLPSVTISYATPFCSDGSVQNVSFTNNTGAYTGGTFTSDANLTIDPSTGAITPSSSTTGNHTVTYNIPAAGGCTASPVTTTINITEKPVITDFSYATPFCISETVAQAATLTGTSGGTYSATPAGLSIAANGSITPSAGIAGNYTVTYTIAAAAGCAAVTRTTPVQIVEVKFARDSVKYEICDSGESKTLVGDAAANGILWTWEDAGYNPIAGETGMTMTVSPTSDATYWFVAHNGNCFARQKHFVKIMQQIDFKVPDDFAVCPGEKVELVAELIGTPPTESYVTTWWKKSALDSIEMYISGNPSTKNLPSEDTRYRFEVVLENGLCPNDYYVNVTIADLPEIVAIEEIDKKQFTFRAAGTEPLEFSLDNIDGNYQLESLFDINRIGKHIVYVKDGNGCIADSAFVVPEIELIFPTYFNPSSEREDSRIWQIGNLTYYPNIDLRIFDRFGKELEKTTNSLTWKGWDGTYLRKKLPSDDYWYLLIVRETGKQYMGHFTLLR
ncbi:MAG: T9SS type B sorting domain-containing protein [Prevotellaceae bacterium]|nr:T9SS type B sorting domain-containing protein [Prevotellaceae bacterium]